MAVGGTAFSRSNGLCVDASRRKTLVVGGKDGGIRRLRGDGDGFGLSATFIGSVVRSGSGGL